MTYFSSQPHWWPAAQQQGLVQGDAAPADDHEPSVLVIAMAMLGVLVCMVPLLAFAFLGLGEEIFLGNGGMVLGLLALVGGGALLRSGPQAFTGCAGLVLWLLGEALVLINLGADYLDSRPHLLTACVLLAALKLLGAWLSPARWIQTIMGVAWAVAVFVFFMVLQSWLPWLSPLQLDSLLLVALWWLWLRAEPARLARPRQGLAQTRWAVFADAAIVGVLAFTQFIEPILRTVATFVEGLGDVTAYLPGAASDALVGASIFTTMGGAGGGSTLTWWGGGLLLLGYAVVFLALGWMISWRRDVS